MISVLIKTNKQEMPVLLLSTVLKRLVGLHF